MNKLKDVGQCRSAARAMGLQTLIEDRPTYKVCLRCINCMTKLLAESAGHNIGKSMHKYDLQLSRRVQIVTVPVDQQN